MTQSGDDCEARTIIGDQTVNALKWNEYLIVEVYVYDEPDVG